MLFVCYLAIDNLKVRTIKSYLSALRFSQIIQGLPDPFVARLPLFDCALKGIKRAQVEGGAPSKPRLPITPPLLRILKVAWIPPVSSPDPDGLMLWAASCTGFFGFLRAAEFTTPSKAAYDPGAHLSLSDVALASHTKSEVVRITIKASKTDPFRKGVQVYLGKTGADICPVSALVSYLAVRGAAPGPLFVFVNGTPLSRLALVQHVRSAISAAGIDASPYSGHSFRIGAASTAAKNGVEDCMIQTLGRWKSAAYLRYVRLPRELLAGISMSLVTE